MLLVPSGHWESKEVASNAWSSKVHYKIVKQKELFHLPISNTSFTLRISANATETYERSGANNHAHHFSDWKVEFSDHWSSTDACIRPEAHGKSGEAFNETTLLKIQPKCAWQGREMHLNAVEPRRRIRQGVRGTHSDGRVIRDRSIPPSMLECISVLFSLFFFSLWGLKARSYV